MPLTNAYTDLITLKGFMGITVPDWDAVLEMSINAASRSIDNYCQRKFWLDPAATAKTFIPESLLHLDIAEQDPLGGDIGTTAGLIVATDASGDGTYEKVWDTADYQLQPVNAATASPEAKPWTAIHAVGTKTFPWLVNTWLTHLDRVQITARWGWPAVPSTVTYAAVLKAARLFHRKDSPQGIAGFGDFAAIYLSKGADGDVVDMLIPYRRQAVFVAVNIGDIRQGLADRLVNIPGINIYPDQVLTPQVPAALIVPPTGTNILAQVHSTQGHAVCWVNLTVMMLGQQGELSSAQALLDSFVASGSTEASSVIDALESDALVDLTGVGGICGQVVVDQVSNYGFTKIGTNEYPSVLFHIRVPASRA